MLKAELYKEIARNVGCLTLETTATGGSTNSIVSTDMVYPQTDQIRGQEVYIWSGAQAYNSRVVASFNTGSDAAHIVPALSAAPSTNSQFILLKQFRIADMKGAVDRAFGIARNLYYDTYYTTITLVASQYEYTVPSGLDAVGYLQLVPTSGSDYMDDSDISSVFEIKRGYWKLEKNIIVFDPRIINMDNYDLKSCRVYGQSRAPAIPSDSSTVPSMLEEYLIAKGSQLIASRIDTTKYNQFKGMADDLEKYLRTQVRGDLVR